MKKVYVYLILLLAGIGWMITSTNRMLVLELSRMQAKHEIKQDIRTGKYIGQTCILSFSKTDIQNPEFGFEWKDEKQEFKWQETMHDIISIEEVGDSVRIHCVIDTKESELEARIESLTTNILKETATEKNHTLAKSLLDIQYLRTTELILPVLHTQVLTAHRDYIQMLVLDGHTGKLITPPKCS